MVLMADDTSPAAAPECPAPPPCPKPASCDMHYDHIIVGAGPAGLTLATYLPGRILLLERDATIGGIHKVRRDVSGYFGEHGPRMYSGSFVNTKRVLRDIGTSWDQVFTQATYAADMIDGKRWYRWLSAREVLVLATHFARMVVNDDHGKHVTMRDMCRQHGFSEASTQYLDHVCRFADGAGSDRFSLHEFMRLFTDHVGGFYAPSQATDKVLLPTWQRFLERRGVVIKLACPVREIVHRCGRTMGVIAGNTPQEYTARRVILAIPPTSLLGLLKASKLKEPGLACFQRATRYDEYFPVAYHFPATAAPLVTHEGLKSTPWGLVYIEMTRYIKGESTTFVQAATSRPWVRSPHTGKTVHESTRQEAVAEILRQLPIDENVKKQLVKAVPSSCLARSKDGKRWINIDDAYVYSAAAPNRGLPFALQCSQDLFTVGCQNLQSWYPVTSIEAAVCNAMVFMGQRQEVPTTLLTKLRATLILAALFLVLWVAKRWLWRRRRR